MQQALPLSFRPATPDRFADVANVIGVTGDARRCWCAHWYLPQRDYEAGRKDGSNRAWLEARVGEGTEPGVIAYWNERPVGWCGVGPRAAMIRLARSRNLAPVDEAEVWSITCFVVVKEARRQGLMRPMIEAAVEHARQRGARIVEGYPLDLHRKAYAGEFYVGTLRAFLDQGFAEVARRSPTRPIVRRVLEKS